MPPKTEATYKAEILKKHQENTEKSGYLLKPTPKKIQKACLHFFEQRNQAEDTRILNAFFQFDATSDRKNFIKNYELEKFKPIQNFLNGGTKKPTSENVDFTAWLVDFTPRPFFKYLQEENDEKVPTTENDPPQTVNTPGENEEDENKPTKTRNSSWYKIAGIALLVCISLILGINYLMQEVKTNTEKIPIEKNNLTNIPEKCMAWNGIEYKLANCADSIHPTYLTKVVPYDESDFKNLKKVTVDIETPFFEANNKTPLIWYYKLGKGKFEYYKSHGIHPVNGEPLEDITQYHIDKYIPKHKPKNSSFLQED
ncbi:hypothetical protein U8527_02475 [Kordia algicida OT-1]|uniref:Uncharacterized protein n=1 Tax=Kordia algicida OT-1 TaxID=391587 RepID=A9DNF2_9FLAO|nr:hypothetical protein [Kordia algicida]EDP97176.1 hypothetical protein KAOT1_18477 [Kordia algicida OT-1]